MAQARKHNVVIIDTTADTLAGPLAIKDVRAVGGAASSSASISSAGVTVWQSATIGAGSVDESRGLNLRVGGGETLTFTLAGAGTKLYLYLH
jgi:hypothetical protein